MNPTPPLSRHHPARGRGPRRRSRMGRTAPGREHLGLVDVPPQSVVGAIVAVAGGAHDADATDVVVVVVGADVKGRVHLVHVVHGGGGFFGCGGATCRRKYAFMSGGTKIKSLNHHE